MSDEPGEAERAFESAINHVNSEENSVYVWRAFGASVRGKSHLLKGVPNQDAVRWVPELDGRSVLDLSIMAVADGHGQTKSVRSNVGSRLAVEVARDSLREFEQEVRDNYASRHGLWKALVEEELRPTIVARWREKVEQDIACSPFSEEELKKIDPKSKDVGQGASHPSRFKAYGTTLLAAMVARHFIVVLQIGDGGLVAVNESGEFSRPLPDDPLNIGNETTSLSDPDAETRMRVRLMPLEGAIPVMLLLCTDGYENAFTSTVFEKVCRDFVQELRAPGGWGTVFGYLEACLEEASSQATGDDATIGILFREGADYANWPEKTESTAAARNVGNADRGSESETQSATPAADEEFSFNTSDFTAQSVNQASQGEIGGVDCSGTNKKPQVPTHDLTDDGDPTESNTADGDSVREQYDS
ncbi:MAG: PP2C family serine/threonine-protein phosphatase [Pirellulales bacterium]